MSQDSKQVIPPPLKSCGHCGGSAVMVTRVSLGTEPGWWLRCECGAAMFSPYGKVDCFRRWNRRTDSGVIELPVVRPQDDGPQDGGVA